jgi:DNA-binding LacI/PurR family transcriptional regulator
MTDSLTGPDGVPLREQLQELLRKRILDNQLEKGDRLPSARELAATYNVSLGTVSNALQELKRQGLLQTRRKKGIFVPTGDKPQRRKRTGNIGVLAEGASEALNDRMNFEVFNSVRTAAGDRGYNIIYLGTKEYRPGNAGAEDFPEFRRIDGLVYIINVRPSPSVVRRAVERSLPVVLTDWFDPELNADGVVINNTEGGLKAMRHLIGLGHRRIAFLNASSSQSADERLAAYRSALAAADIPFDPKLVRFTPSTVLQGQLAMRQLLPATPTAVFAFNDYLALGAILAAQLNTLNVPQQLSVIGFGGQGEGLASGLGVKLTTMKVDYSSIGTSAVELLFSRIAGDTQPPQVLRVDARLRQGNTTSRAAKSRA